MSNKEKKKILNFTIGDKIITFTFTDEDIKGLAKYISIIDAKAGETPRDCGQAVVCGTC